MKFDNKQVCKNYLCGLCPGSLFKNTKFKHILSKSLRCNKIHSHKLKKDYKKYIKQAQVHQFNKRPTYFHNLEQDLKKCIKFSQKLFKIVNNVVVITYVVILLIYITIYLFQIYFRIITNVKIIFVFVHYVDLMY